MDTLEFAHVPGQFAISKLPAVPFDLSRLSRPWHVSVTEDEISLVCHEREVPDNAIRKETGWIAYRVAGQLDFALTGILARLTSALADVNVPVCAVSTFDTDYLMVRETDQPRAEAALRRVAEIT